MGSGIYMGHRKVSILAVDDDVGVLRLMRTAFEAKGYRVVTASDGKLGLELLDREAPDIVLLDITMPDPDGYSVCRRIREFSRVPVIMVSARGDEFEKIRGFECGADDYVTKPFYLTELAARVQLRLNRTPPEDSEHMRPIAAYGDIKIDFVNRSVTRAGRVVYLTSTEFGLLRELVLNRGKVLTHSYLLQKVWGPEYSLERHYLHVFIGRLRNKLRLNQRSKRYLRTWPGVGYQFTESPTRDQPKVMPTKEASRKSSLLIPR